MYVFVHQKDHWKSIEKSTDSATSAVDKSGGCRAVSANRCYRRALPLDTCFQIIKEGRGTDFEPLLVDVFLDKEEEIRQICEERGSSEQE